MGQFRFSQRSLDRMVGVHPDLVIVIQRALELSPYDFGIKEGKRDLARQEMLYAQGKSTTLNSLHLEQDDGYSHAIDLYVLVNGKVTWKHKYFRKVVQAVFTAAIELGVQVSAGALWRDFLDSPHIQLNQDYYGSWW